MKRVKTEAEYGIHWIGNVLPCSETAVGKCSIYEPSKDFDIVSRQVQLRREYGLKEYYAAAVGASMEVA